MAKNVARTVVPASRFPEVLMWLLWGEACGLSTVQYLLVGSATGLENERLAWRQVGKEDAALSPSVSRGHWL